VKKRDKLATVRRVYPRAITTADSIEALFDLLEDRFDLEPRQIMLADSICSDDVNTIEYPQRAYEMLGPFKMGGLNGFPFTGLTGMGAFAGHVPDDGAVMIYYAPHIGISKNGAVGELLRIGQSRPSGCCGAARAALKRLEDGLIEPGVVTELDYQMNTIEQIFFRNRDRILQSNDRLLQATEVMYEEIHARIQVLAAQTKYRCRYLLLVGAILINADHDMGSFTEPRHFTVLDLQSGTRVDVIDDYLSRIR
jgi:Limiting CO2-inducible proteins B/C beta carbonyic anhydrases